MIDNHSDSVPPYLRKWFVLHFLADVVLGFPLLFAPRATLFFFGWSNVEPLTARLVGAALLGIGIESFLGRNGSKECLKGMLNLKIIWSSAANIGIALSIYEGAPPAAILFQLIFLAFSALWIFYRYKLQKNE